MKLNRRYDRHHNTFHVLGRKKIKSIHEFYENLIKVPIIGEMEYR